jgi:hypothetical protein
MAKTTPQTNIASANIYIEAALEKLRKEYTEAPTNPIGSLISVLELSLIDIKKIKNGLNTKGN